jgi:hypothetical protein
MPGIYKLFGGHMAFAKILSDIDEEIARLKQARALLTASEVPDLSRQSPHAIEKPSRKKHKITPEGRKRIREAVKRRWATQKKAAGK